MNVWHSLVIKLQVRGLGIAFCVVGSSAVDCLERVVSEMTCYIWGVAVWHTRCPL